ncbi:dihydroxyacetone kinase [Paraburkholderia sp. JPY465]
MLVHKIAGAAAARGLPLAEVARIAKEAAASLGTMGVALTPCTVPAAGKPGFELGDREIEWGLGIHGEPGVARGALEPADAMVGKLLATTSRTASMHPRRGRSSYVGERAIGHVDPGAHAVALWLAAIREALSGQARANANATANATGKRACTDEKNNDAFKAAADRTPRKQRRRSARSAPPNAVQRTAARRRTNT